MRYDNYQHVRTESIVNTIVYAIEREYGDRYIKHDIIEDVLEDYWILRRYDVDKKFTLWRFTLPLLVIYLLLLFFCVLPIKWIITGNWYLGNTSIFHKIYHKWSTLMEGHQLPKRSK